MAIKFRKNAIKFLEKANLEDAEKIQEKISQLLAFVEEQAIIPFTELDIKKMSGLARLSAIAFPLLWFKSDTCGELR